MIKLETNNHSVFSLNYHLVIVTKYRRRVFDSEEMFVRLRGMAEYIGESHNVTISEMNGEPDHVHFLLKTNYRRPQKIHRKSSRTRRLN